MWESGMNWYRYKIFPIDYGWDNLKTVSQTVADLAIAENREGIKHDVNTKKIKAFLKQLDLAKEMAREIGWEGDFRHEPYVFYLPSEGEFVYGFAFKHDNNGDTFVISPIELPWLDQIALH